MIRSKKVPILYNKKEECCGCAACVAICPQDAISMKLDEEGFYYPEIEDMICIGCLLCKKVCPMQETTHN